MQAKDRITRSYGKETSLGVAHLSMPSFCDMPGGGAERKGLLLLPAEMFSISQQERATTLLPPEGPPRRECGTGGDLAAHSHHKHTNSLNAFSRLAPAFLSWKQEL